MNSGKLNDWLGVLANFGVIVGIFFLVLELQQNQALMQVQIQQGRAEMGMNLNIALAESVQYVPILIKDIQGEPLTLQERGILSNYLRASLLNQENIYLQYEMGMLDESTLERLDAFTREIIMGTASGKLYWDASKAAYSPGFADYIDAVIAGIESQ